MARKNDSPGDDMLDRAADKNEDAGILNMRKGKRGGKRMAKRGRKRGRGRY
jgi:hypothetical protein